MFGVIETGGKQYIVRNGDRVRVEKLSHESSSVVFDKVLLVVNGNEAIVGAPYVKDASVSATIIAEQREKKKIVFRYHSKTRYRKKKTHRQHYTDVEIKEIIVPAV